MLHKLCVYKFLTLHSIQVISCYLLGLNVTSGGGPTTVHSNRKHAYTSSTQTICSFLKQKKEKNEIEAEEVKSAEKPIEPPQSSKQVTCSWRFCSCWPVIGSHLKPVILRWFSSEVVHTGWDLDTQICAFSGDDVTSSGMSLLIKGFLWQFLCVHSSIMLCMRHEHSRFH